jgi:hypothetical protein
MAKLDTVLCDLGHTLIDFRSSSQDALEVYAEVHRRLAASGHASLPPVEELA